jgi:LacI family transcriptional regulator/LacI family repressor for deo operon, udp, cdd, tsx, nupC, and nupG
MPNTIKDIAKQAGVSHTTVSRALHNSPLISTQTTQRIQEIAAQMGYHPSAAARSLKTNRSQVLGVIVSHIADPFFSEVLQGIDDVAQESGYSLFIASAQHNPDRENTIVQTMREHRVDGVILCSPHFMPEQFRRLSSYNVPIVAINNQSEEEFPFSIYHDDADGSRQVTQHLISLGHRKISYLGDSLAGRTTCQRLSGFVQTMQEYDLPVHQEYVHQVAGNSAVQGLAWVGSLLRMQDKPTSVVCYNDMMAVGVLKGLKQAGLIVPDDISVTGFDNILVSDYTQPPLTTIDQPKRFLGAEAGRMMLSQLRLNVNIDNDGRLINHLKGMLIIRKSTSPPPKGKTLVELQIT